MGKTCVAQMSSLQSTSGHLQGTWGLEGFPHLHPPPWDLTPPGTQQESFRPPALPATQACLHARPGLALGPHTSLHSAGPSKEGPEPRSSWGSHTFGAGWAYKATGYYSMQRHVQSQKAGACLPSISRRDGVKLLWSGRPWLMCPQGTRGRVTSKYSTLTLVRDFTHGQGPFQGY